MRTFSMTSKTSKASRHHRSRLILLAGALVFGVAVGGVSVSGAATAVDAAGGGVAAHHTLALASTAASTGSSSTGSSSTQPDPPFDAGFIISDDSFFNFQAMTELGVQKFLDSAACVPADDSPCLADYQQRTRTIAASTGRCERYSGRFSESAASIIWRVSQACGISPQVLLVLVQKEQSLVTHPSAFGYQRATGYACPDTAKCNAKYFGFFNQVYQAAWQFREYTLHPSEWRYRVGRVAIQYHPTITCGSRVVNIVNQATANLYNYTPYQPNADTLAHPRGPAGQCSSYGNLNFSRLFNQWFGSPTAVTFTGWVPACLNFVGGTDCPTVTRFPGVRS
jgi:hypothetical protein